MRNGIAAVLLGVAFVLIAGSAAGPRSCTIVNGTRTAMIMLQLKETNAAKWQVELLDKKPLGVQKETVYRMPGNACVYDLKAMFEDGHRLTRQRVDLCKTPRYVLSDF